MTARSMATGAGRPTAAAGSGCRGKVLPGRTLPDRFSL